MLRVYPPRTPSRGFAKPQFIRIYSNFREKLPKGFQRLPKDFPKSFPEAPRSFPAASQRLPRDLQKLPKGSQGLPEVPKSFPKGFPKASRSFQKVPRGSQKLPRSFPKEASESFQEASQRLPTRAMYSKHNNNFEKMGFGAATGNPKPCKLHRQKSNVQTYALGFKPSGGQLFQ